VQASDIPVPISGRAGSYTKTAVVLHWVIAAGAVTMIGLGWWMISIPKDPPGVRLAAFNLHKSIGITIFLLMAARLTWRLAHRPPPLPAMPRWQARAARVNHALLYACLLLMPVAGFTASSFSGRPIVYFGYPLPVLLARNDAIAQAFYAVHLTVSWILVAAIAVHVAATIKHQFIDRDNLMRRMGLWPRGSVADAAGVDIARPGPWTPGR
jgi:cytochrome b561